MISPWWSVLLTTVGGVGIYLTGRKLWFGFAVGLGAQVLWVAYGLTTGQWGFLGSAAVYGWMNFLGLRRWLREKEREQHAPSRTP